MTSTPLLVLDVPNLVNRSYYAMYKMDFYLPGVFGLLRDLRAFSDTLKSSRFAFCFDSSTSLRKAIYPAYKATRKINDNSEIIKKEIAMLRDDVLPMIGYQNIYTIDGAEADDIMAILVGYVIEPDDDAVMITTDHDLYQWLDHCLVTIWNPITKSVITQRSVEEKTGVLIEDWVEFRSMTGCKTDNIKGLPKVAEKTAAKFLNGNLSENGMLKMRNLLKEHKDRMELNRLLVNLPFQSIRPKFGDPTLPLYEDEIEPGTWDMTVAKFGLSKLIGKCPNGRL